MPKQITSDNTVTLPDGTTIETVTYDDSSKSVTITPVHQLDRHATANEP